MWAAALWCVVTVGAMDDSTVLTTVVVTFVVSPQPRATRAATATAAAARRRDMEDLVAGTGARFPSAAGAQAFRAMKRYAAARAKKSVSARPSSVTGASPYIHSR